VVNAPDDSQPDLPYDTDSERSLQSEDYHSPGETDGLGSVGDLEDDDASASEAESGGGEGEL
jgi:hypothetical protein